MKAELIEVIRTASCTGKGVEGDPMRELVRYWSLDGELLRADIPRRELEVYLHVFECGKSARWVARRFKVHRSSVRSYLRRLLERVGA